MLCLAESHEDTAALRVPSDMFSATHKILSYYGYSVIITILKFLRLYQYTLCLKKTHQL